MIEPTPGELPRSAEAFGPLRRPMRRRVIVELAGRDRPVGVDELATAVTRSGTARADAVPVDATDPAAAPVELHHEQLPKLAAAGWIEYDGDADPPWCRLRSEEVRSALRVASEELRAVRPAVEATTSESDDG